MRWPPMSAAHLHRLAPRRASWLSPLSLEPSAHRSTRRRRSAGNATHNRKPRPPDRCVTCAPMGCPKPDMYPGGVRAASFCYGYDARACASGPPQNWPHSRHPQCQPGTCRQRPTGTHAPFPLSRCRQEPGQRGPRDPIRPPPDCEPSAQPGLTRAGPARRVPLRLADWRLWGSARLLQKPAGRRKTSCPWLKGKQTARQLDFAPFGTVMEAASRPEAQRAVIYRAARTAPAPAVAGPPVLAVRT
jgi:hypothetical protein